MLHDELVRNARMILGSAEAVLGRKDYTSATILYFKVLFGVIDIILLKALGRTPKDHTERFRMLEEKHPDLYELLDKDFTIYRDTYTTSIDRETCQLVRLHVKGTIERYHIPL